MAVRVYSPAELNNIAQMQAHDFKTSLRSMTPHRAMLLRRNLQISLAHYSKSIPSRNGGTHIHKGITKACSIIEMACYRAYMHSRFPREWAIAQGRGVPKRAVKKKIKADWEKFVKRNSY